MDSMVLRERPGFQRNPWNKGGMFLFLYLLRIGLGFSLLRSVCSQQGLPALCLKWETQKGMASFLQVVDLIPHRDQSLKVAGLWSSRHPNLHFPISQIPVTARAEGFFVWIHMWGSYCPELGRDSMHEPQSLPVLSAKAVFRGVPTERRGCLWPAWDDITQGHKLEVLSALRASVRSTPLPPSLLTLSNKLEMPRGTLEVGGHLSYFPLVWDSMPQAWAGEERSTNLIKFSANYNCIWAH